MRWLGILAVSLFSLAVSGTAQAGPCDQHTNAFAYNECLSKQAPPRSTSGARAGAGGDPEQTVRGARRGGGRIARGGGGSYRGMTLSRHGGRVRATIDPWSGMRGTPSRKRRR